MSKLWIFLLACGTLCAQNPLAFTIYNPANPAASVPLPSTYNFGATPEGSSDTIQLIPTNTSGSQVKLIGVTLSDSQDFSVTNVYVDAEIAPGSTAPAFFVHFTPQQTGALTSTMNVIYCLPSGAQNTCSSSVTETAATFQGNGSPAQLTLTCTGTPALCNGKALVPASTIDFGNIADGAAASAQFTVENQTESSISTANLISLTTPVFNTSPFSLDTSSLPATLAAGASASFTVKFSPGQAVLMQATLNVNGNPFPLQGTGVANPIGDPSSLVVTYTDPTGVRLTAQGGTPIVLPQTVAGVTTPAVLNFVVSNPATTIGPVTVPAISVSGSGFAVSGLPTMPASIQPGSTLSFQLSFQPSAAGSYSGTLIIGALQFSLSAQSVASQLPSISFQLSQQPLTSAQQVNLTIQLASAATVPAVGTLTMTFAPSVQNVSDDPAVKFIATGTRQLNLSVAAGATTATYNGQSQLTFQTGTTAGTITFTLQFPNTAPLIQSFTIPPDKIHIVSATASVSSPNLVITINGYDNTYSAGQLSFTFYDTQGNPVAPGAMSVNAAPQFQQYFFNNNQAGGAFALQATFPVYGGEASQVGSVAVTMTNSAGSVTTTQTF
jgi:hypothetical protein